MPATESTLIAPIRAFIALGGNEDDPVAHLERAFDELAALPSTDGMRRSSLYRTPPWGGVEQADFVNAVAELHTRLGPRALLDALLAIERAHGRMRSGPRWGPRRLDLDLVLYGDRRIDESGLVVPHPRLGERAFVLVPLAELDAEVVVPGVGRAAELLAALPAIDRAAVIRIERA